MSPTTTYTSTIILVVARKTWEFNFNYSSPCSKRVCCCISWYSRHQYERKHVLIFSWFKARRDNTSDLHKSVQWYNTCSTGKLTVGMKLPDLNSCRTSYCQFRNKNRCSHSYWWRLNTVYLERKPRFLSPLCMCAVFRAGNSTLGAVGSVS